MSDAPHWAAAYIGMPWSPANTCWHFCARVWAEVFGITVPLVEIDGADGRATRRALSASTEATGWHEVAVAAEGDGVLMAMGARPCHVGIWINLEGVLHSVEGVGGIFTPAHRLADLGYRIVGIYRRGAP